jgi:hypothetical protein
VSTDGLGCVSASTVDLGSAPGTQRTARCLSPAISLASGTPQPLPLVTLRAASNKGLISVCRQFWPNCYRWSAAANKMLRTSPPSTTLHSRLQANEFDLFPVQFALPAPDFSAYRCGAAEFKIQRALKLS